MIYVAIICLLMIFCISQHKSHKHTKTILRSMVEFVNQDKKKQSDYIKALSQAKAEVADLLNDTETLKDMDRIPGHLLIYHKQSLILIHDTLSQAQLDVYKIPEGLEDASEAQAEKARKASQRKIRIRIPEVG